MNAMVLWMRRAFETILDAILPPRARAERARSLTPETIPLTIAVHELLRSQITTLMDYRAQEVRDVIQSLKYDGSGSAAHLCAAVLSEFLAEELSDLRSFSAKKTVIVPLPLHASRARERGFNQIELVLKALPPEYRNGTRASVESELLERTRPTKPQTHFSRSERLSNVAGAFALRDTNDLKGVHVYLIDDVATTGATLVNASTPLRRAGASVSLIALARA